MDFKFGRPEDYSPLVLAYLGDAVFELYIRSWLVSKANMPVNELNTCARSYVKAEAQARMYHKISEGLTDAELAALKRGRNAKANTIAKNASVGEYRHATGLEALFGYLFINGEHDRLSQIFSECVKENNYERI